MLTLQSESEPRLRYFRKGIDKVDGWLHTADRFLIWSLCGIQTENDIGGAIGEIGVHHGKLFILLYLSLHKEEAAFCIDVFDNQTLNVDGSGRGDETIFLQNFSAYADSGSLRIIKSSSLEVSRDDILSAAGPARLISIDGGHTKEITSSDMSLCESVLSEQGLLIIDDYFNAAWPGVSEGVNAYVLENRQKLVPFAIGMNKVFFTRPTLHSLYREELRRRCREMYRKPSELFGSPVDVFDGYSSLSCVLSYSRLGALQRLARLLEAGQYGLQNWLAVRLRH